MSLLDAPTPVWRDIFLNWVAFPTVVRCDCALSVLAKNPLLPAYEHQEFAFPERADCKSSVNPVHLYNLCRWLQSRNVYVTTLEFGNDCEYRTVKSLASTWAALFSWTGSKMQQLVVRDSSLLKYLFDGTLEQCSALRDLTVENLSEKFHLGSVLRSLSRTLHSLRLINMVALPCGIGTGDYVLPHLRTLQLHKSGGRFQFSRNWNQRWNDDVPRFLCMCPALTALSLPNNPLTLQIADAIADTCTQLQRLQVLFDAETVGPEYVFDTMLQRIVRSNPAIAFLEIRSGVENVEHLSNIVGSLPQLSTLVVDALWDRTANAIAMCGAPSLRVLDVSANTCATAIQAVTRACPQLTSLDISGLSYFERTVIIDVLQSCGELRHLRGVLEARAMNLVLQSAARYCPHLLTLTMYSDRYSLEYCEVVRAGFDAVLANCTQLQRLATDVLVVDRIAVPLANPSLLITDDEDVLLTGLEDWMPNMYHRQRGEKYNWELIR